MVLDVRLPVVVLPRVQLALPVEDRTVEPLLVRVVVLSTVNPPEKSFKPARVCAPVLTSPTLLPSAVCR